jgi:hypothetical protein
VEFPILFPDRTTGDDQGLSDSSIIPRRCMSSCISLTFARGGLLGGWRIGRDVSRIYAVTHFVSPSVVFAVHSKEIFVSGEELIQILKFYIS